VVSADGNHGSHVTTSAFLTYIAAIDELTSGGKLVYERPREICSLHFDQISQQFRKFMKFQKVSRKVNAEKIEPPNADRAFKNSQKVSKLAPTLITI
jgi:RNA processing factor Prp31